MATVQLLVLVLCSQVIHCCAYSSFNGPRDAFEEDSNIIEDSDNYNRITYRQKDNPDNSSPQSDMPKKYSEKEQDRVVHYRDPSELDVLYCIVWPKESIYGKVPRLAHVMDGKHNQKYNMDKEYDLKVEKFQGFLPTGEMLKLGQDSKCTFSTISQTLPPRDDSRNDKSIHFRENRLIGLIKEPAGRNVLEMLDTIGK